MNRKKVKILAMIALILTVATSSLFAAYKAGYCLKADCNCHQYEGDDLESINIFVGYGRKCFLTIKNDSGDDGHYIYGIKIENTSAHRTVFSSSNLNLTSSKNSGSHSKTFDFYTDDKYPRNKIRVTISAKGGTKGSISTSRTIDVSSTNSTTMTLYYRGYSIGSY